MLIYKFIRKVQDEHAKAKSETKRLDGMQSHDKAQMQRVRAAALWDVLTWAGFEGCDIVKREEP